MGSITLPTASKMVAAAGEDGHGMQHRQLARAYSNPKVSCFRMPLHYPRYTRADYEVMPEWKLDCLLTEYGLPASGDLAQKRRFAMGAFLWPAQY
ncbi:hypothetical protein Taro_008250 [Colocasia esculenta]|uniref:DUF7722 domain-containing protein n=1 Tax=Colocasia esculenta TaxID=4460 RepID=A0A843TX33_COLES|nr:hypothetical protein [Colocasia esculenta]